VTSNVSVAFPSRTEGTLMSSVYSVCKQTSIKNSWKALKREY